MRDFGSNQRDEDDRERVMAMATTPVAARTPSSSRRSSFSILGAAHASASNPNSGSQGSFVASFAMARDEQTAYLELARSQLPQLVVECANGSKATAAGTGVTDNGDEGDAGTRWRRLKPKKKSDVLVWEKGGLDGSTSSSNSSRSKKKTRSNNGASTTPRATDTFTTTTRGHDTFADADAFHSPVVTYAVRSAVRVNAPLDVVLKTLDCSAVTAYRSFTKIIYESLVADTSVLYHSQSPSASTSTTTTVTPRPSTMAIPQIPSCCGPRESLAVRWMVCRCNNPMVSDCDLCLLEYSKVTSVDDAAPPRPRDGKPLFTFRANNNNNQGSSSPSRAPRDGLHDRREFPSAYKILSSVEIKSCPELLDSHRLTRCFVPLGGFLFYPTDNADVTDVVFYMSVAQDRLFHNSNQQLAVAGSGNPFSAASSSERQFRAIQRVLQHMARGVGRIKNAVDAYTMSLRLEMLRNTRWVRNTERAECVCCYRRFHQLTRRRHHCRLCGDVICRDCSVYKDADLPTIGPTILRICKLCDLNELKASSAAAAAALAIGKQLPEELEAFDVGDGDTVVAEEAKRGVTFASKKLTRKRSTTLNVDTSKTVVHDHDQEPQIGRRFTTVVDGKHRRELPEQAFSCSKADIVDRPYKWNTGGGGGKPRVVLSPQSAALYASRTGQRTPGFTNTGGGLSAGAASAKAMTPTGRQRAVAPQDWSATHQQLQQSNQSNQQAKSCSKIASTRDRFAAFSFRNKGATPTNEVPPKRRTADPESDRELDEIGEDDEEKYAAYPSAVHPKTSLLAGNVAIVHPARVVKSGKLVVPGQEVMDKTTAGNNNQQHEFSSKPLPRKLANVERYEDILLTLCEQVSKALDCNYAALSLFTGIPQQQQSSSSFAPLTAASLARLASPSASSSPKMFSSPSTPGATGGGYENYPAVHFLKACGGKKLAKVAANLMCCAPILELKDKLITRDALASCNMFDFKKLPIVIGPQQVRFYAGIPLVDCNNQVVGAFAVFDSNVYQGSSMNEVLPTMEAFAAVALTAIEDRKTDLELQSFLKNPLVDTKSDNQAIRLSEPVFHIDMDARHGFNDDDDEFFHTDPPYGNAQAIQIRPRFSSRPPPRQQMSPHVAAAPPRDVEYYKSQMEQLVRQARETEAQMLENSMAMKRQGVAIW